MRCGYFDEKENEYVIEREDLPVSWTNYLGVEEMAAVVNHTAGGYLFYKSPEYHRITRFRANAVPMDRPGFYVYLRDAKTEDYWSVSWQPVGKPPEQAEYRTRHGLSYTVYESRYDRISASQKMSVPLGENALIWDVTVTNQDEHVRTLDLFAYTEFSFHHIAIDNQNFQMSLYCSGSAYRDGVIVHDLYYEEEGYQYFAGNFEPDGYDTVREAFIGTYQTETDPKAVTEGHCGGSEELGGNHCGALQKKLVLQPKETKRILLFLGEGGYEEAVKIRRKYADPAVLDEAYEALRRFWQNKQERMHIHTPDAGMNTMINTWTLYQSEINVIFSRFASFIEVGGRTGLGYRDTAQDAMTVIHSNPEKCRQRLIELLRALTSRGYGIHLFEPSWFAPKREDETKKKPFRSPTVIPEPEASSKVHGIKDACSDDALWLIPSITEYVKETGDTEFLYLTLGYCDGGEGTVYDHMKAILNFSLEEVGEHGVCLGLRADWNDCLNLGGGESALVSFLLAEALNCFLEITCRLGRTDDFNHYNDELIRLKARLNKVLWDGNWFLRGFTAGGKKIGTDENEEGKVHLESNAWAVLSGCAEKEQAERALESIHTWLATPWGIMLNAPAYTKPDDEIGFITRVYPGLKENGSVFSHPNPWVWAAECRMGHGNRAMEYYHSLTPYYQNDRIETRYAEPYSYCQFISGKDHSTYGRAHHPFMTGSGGWSYYSATHYMLGIRPDFERLIIDPCIPADWDGFEAQRIWRGSVYRIRVENPDHVEYGVKKILLDGRETDTVPADPEHAVHEVIVIMGENRK